MAKGISLHIGINEVDDTHYRKTIFEGDGWKGELKGCEADALAMEKIAIAQGFQHHRLLTKAATRQAVKAQIAAAANQLDAGDYFFLTYSGHGSQVMDRSGDEQLALDPTGQKRDRRDETWCLYDAQLLDDELQALWATFKKGVRILIFSDSCHSGTIGRVFGMGALPVQEGMAYRLIPKASMSATYKVHRDFYDGLQGAAGELVEIEARVLLLSGCQDNELSREDQSAEQPGGLFTKSLLRVWEKNQFTNHQDFFEQIKQGMPDDQQTPNYDVFGGADPGFESSRPLQLLD